MRLTEAERQDLAGVARTLVGSKSIVAVCAYGSKVAGYARPDSDYDLIIVSPYFAAIHPLDRGRGLRELWMRVGGYGSMDLICMTPEEFETAKHRISLIQAVLPELVDLLSAGEAATSASL